MSSDRRGQIDGLGTAAILAALLCWSLGPLFIRYLTGYLDAWSQNFWRYTFAVIFWLPFLFVGIRKGRVRPIVFRRAVLPAVPNIVMQCLWAWSFYFVEPGFATLLSKSSLIWIAVFSLVYFPDERLLVKSWRFWIAISLSIAGLLIVILTKQGFATRSSLVGIVLMLSAAFAWALYTISVRIYFRDIDSRIGFSVVSLYTVAALAVMALIFGRPSHAFSLAPRPWACIIVSGVVSISLAHTLYYSSMKRIGATIPSLLLQLQPFVVLAFSMVIFTERLNFWQWTGGIILVAGAALSIWAQQHLKIDKSISGNTAR